MFKYNSDMAFNRGCAIVRAHAHTTQRSKCFVYPTVHIYLAYGVCNTYTLCIHIILVNYIIFESSTISMDSLIEN